METLEIRRFIPSDAESVSVIIKRNLLEVNIRDYNLEDMKKLADVYNVEKILAVASSAHMYIACLEGKVVACGSIASYWGKLDESILLTIFVTQELHGKGIGKAIIQALEMDEYFLRAKRIEIPSSITACEFYHKHGYTYKNGIKELDGEGHYRLEKFRNT